MKNFEREPAANSNERHVDGAEKFGKDPDFQKLSKFLQLAEHLEGKTSDEEVQKKVADFAESFAQALENKDSYIHKAYKAVNKGWNKLPHAAQWAILKGEEHLPLTPEICTHLIELGLLKYKGHASPEQRDEEINEKREWTAKKEKWGVRIAEVFAPEVAEFAPVIEVALKLKNSLRNSKENVFSIIRHRLDALKIELETEGKEKKVMKKTPDEDGEVPYADAA